VKFRDEPVDLLIGPCIEKSGVGELWERGLHGSGLLGGALFDSLAMSRRQDTQSLSEGLEVEQRDRKGTDATTGAAEPAGNFTEQGGRCPLKPMIGFPI
jgi:hypothetical protein